MCFKTVKNGKIQLKIGQFAVQYHVFVIVPRQICSYILDKLQLMSATVFTFLRVQHLFFEVLCMTVTCRKMCIQYS